MKFPCAVASLACLTAVCLAQCKESAKPKYQFTGCEWQLQTGAPDDGTCPTYIIKCDGSVDQTCFLKMDSGDGVAIKLRYHFDPRYNRCFPFPYGGSGGNGNNFESRAACAERCKPTTIDTESPTDNGAGTGAIVQPPPDREISSSSCAGVICPVNARCESGHCVTIGDPKCGDNEEVKSCGACDATCTNDHIPCPSLCRAPECGCKIDFVRDSNQKCVLKSSCSPSITVQPVGVGPCATVRCSSDTTCVDGICVQKNKECGINMHYDECGSPCPAICGSDLSSANCVASCKPGCVCDPGFVLDRIDGNCIRKETCQGGHGGAPSDRCLTVRCPPGTKCVNGACTNEAQCGINMHYENCGTACPTRCGDDIVTQPCIELCKPGCVCDRDFVLEVDGSCVRRENCKPQNDNCAAVRCLPGYKCSNGVCIQRNDCPIFKKPPAPAGCTYEEELNEQGCLEPKLHCPGSRGVGSSNGGSSIASIQCGPNAEQSDCASACPSNCDNRGLVTSCPAQCQQGCICKPGYIFKNKNTDEGCVKEFECFIPTNSPTLNPSGGLQCGENEIEKPCGACDSNCNEQTHVCTSGCRQPECGCIDGYRRNNHGKCVAESECAAIGDCSVMLCVPGTTCIHGQCIPNTKNQTCGANEELKECGTACEPTCENPKPEFCTQQCKVNACQCQAGFVRQNGFCIEPSNCEAIRSCAAVSCLAGTYCVEGRCVSQSFNIEK